MNEAVGKELSGKAPLVLATNASVKDLVANSQRLAGLGINSELVSPKAIQGCSAASSMA